MRGILAKRTPGTPLSPEERQQRIDAAKASAAKRRRTLGDYEREVRAIPVLREDEERDLVSRWKGGDDSGARDRLIEAHLRMAVSGARKLAGYGLPMEDMVAAGNLGLLAAAQRFDPEKGARFTTFAAPYIRAAQLAHVQNNWSIVRMGTDRDQKRLFFSLRRELQSIAAGGSVSDEKAGEIAARLGVKSSSVKAMAGRLAGRDASLNTRAGEDDEGDEWIDRLTDGEHAEDSLVARETARIRRASVARAMAGLSERERRVLAARRLRSPPATLQDVGRALGISAERVRQIEGQALRRVQAAVKADPRLAKRKPGTPLSEEELRQRREAARSRWAGVGGALSGALVATGAARVASGAVAQRKVAQDDTGNRAFRLAVTRRDRRHAQIDETLEARSRAAGRPFTSAPETEKGPPGPVTRRMRDLRASIARSGRDEAKVTARLNALDDAFTNGRPAGPGLSEPEALRAQADLRTRSRDAAAELADLARQKPRRKTERAGAVVTRKAATWTRTVKDGRRGKRTQKVTALPGTVSVRQEHKAKVPSTIEPQRMRQIRAAVRARAQEQAVAAHARVEARWPSAAPGLRDAFRARAARVLTGKLRGKWKIPALVGGALAGAAAGYGASRLAKVAPPDDMPFDRPDAITPSAAADEASLASRLAGLFRSWLENPGRAGNSEDIADAMGPLYSVLRRGAGALSPPAPPEDSLYGTPDSRAVIVSFDARSPEVERRLREYALDRIRTITEESRETIRRVLVEASQYGLPVEEQARRIREAIGLSPGQQGWVTSYRQGLEVLDPRVLQRELRDRRHDSPIRRAIETGVPIPREDIDRYVASYHRRALAYRAISIARTEALRGSNSAMIESARVMLQDHPDVTVEKVWIATSDGRTRDAHRELDGKKVIGLDTEFEINGERIRWPHDPNASPSMTVNCRCTLGLRLIPKPGYGRLIAEAA